MALPSKIYHYYKTNTRTNIQKVEQLSSLTNLWREYDMMELTNFIFKASGQIQKYFGTYFIYGC